MPTDSPNERARRICAATQARRRSFSHKSFLQHAWSSLREATLYTRIKRLVAYFRRVRLVAVILRIAGAILTLLEAGALVLLTTVLLLLLLPPLLLFSLAVLLTVLVEAPRKNRALLQSTEGKRIYVLFLPTHGGDFFKANARALAAQKNTAVIVVSPFWFSSRGLSHKRFYCTVRREYENVYLVRRYYFFSLKRHVLQQHNTAFLY